MLRPYLLVFSLLFMFSFQGCEKGEDQNPEQSAEVLEEERVEQVISSNGGKIELKSGARLDIPSGALNTSTSIIVDNINPFDEEINETDTLGGLRASAVLRCEPDGLQFDKPVQLSIPILDDEDLDLFHPDSIILLAVSSSGIDTIPCQIDMENMMATASINHFTEFSLVVKTGKWGMLDEMIDRNDNNFLTLEFNAVRNKAIGSYLIKITSLSRYSQVHQLVSCNIRLYRKKVIVKDEFIQGIQTYKYYTWTADRTDYSYSVNGGTYHNWPDILEYDDFPSKKKMRQIFDVSKISKSNEKAIGIQYVRFGPDKKVSEIDFYDLEDDFDPSLLGNCSLDGESDRLPVVDLSVLDPEKKYYFIIEFIGTGDIVEDNIFSGKARLESTYFTLDDLGGSFPVNSAPIISITSPEDGAKISMSEEREFECYAEDQEDGVLGFNSIKWESSIDGLMGNANYLENPILSAGVHTITATSTDSQGKSSSDAIQVTVEGEPGTAPEADFNADHTTVNQGDLVNFFDLSTNDPTSWLWDFGDGSSQESGKNVSHSYSSAGTYTVNLTATNDHGSDTEVKTDYIQVNAISINKPDLIIQSISLNPDSPIVDESFEVSLTVKNAGLVSSGDCKLVIAIGGESNPPEYDVKGLSPGETLTLVRSSSLSAEGSYRTTATIDIYNEVDEANEDNNEQSRDFTVTEGGSSSSGINFNPDLSYGTMSDIDGNTYKTIQIGEQVWMAENLRTTRYADGTAIPHVESTSAWDDLGYDSKAYCWYDNDTENRDIYGGLYTWSAAVNGTAGSDNNPSGIQGVCPSGWHLPSDAEWKELEMYLGMSQSEADDTGWRGTNEGGKLKESGLNHWNSPNTGATNESGFTALPAGYRGHLGSFGDLGGNGTFWSASEDGPSGAWYRCLYYDRGEVARSSYYRLGGFSVRCLGD